MGTHSLKEGPLYFRCNCIAESCTVEVAFSSESCYDVQFGDCSKKTGGRAEGLKTFTGSDREEQFEDQLRLSWF